MVLQDTIYPRVVVADLGYPCYSLHTPYSPLCGPSRGLALTQGAFVEVKIDDIHELDIHELVDKQ